MTSEEINQQRSGLRPGISDSDALWEIAYQLAKLNEKGLADPEPGKRDAPSSAAGVAYGNLYRAACKLLKKEWGNAIPPAMAPEWRTLSFAVMSAHDNAPTEFQQGSRVSEPYSETSATPKKDSVADPLVDKRDAESSAEDQIFTHNFAPTMNGVFCTNCHCRWESDPQGVCSWRKQKPVSQVSEPYSETSSTPKRSVLKENCGNGFHIAESIGAPCINCGLPMAQWTEIKACTPPSVGSDTNGGKFEPPSLGPDYKWGELYLAAQSIAYGAEDAPAYDRLRDALKAVTAPKES